MSNMSNQNFGWKLVKILHQSKHSQINLWKTEYPDDTCYSDFQKSTTCSKLKTDYLVVKQLKDDKRDKYQVNPMITSSIRILLQLDHQNIVKFFVLPQEVKLLSQSSSAIYSQLGMEYCNGGDLRLVLKNHKNCLGVEQCEAFNIMRDVSSAVFYLHDHEIVHGDLRPENIVLTRKGNKIVYKLIDIIFPPLSCIKQRQHSDYCHVSYVNYPSDGHPEYSIAPKSMDFWSLGILFNEVLTGVLRRTGGDIIPSLIILNPPDPARFHHNFDRLAENENHYLCAEAVGNIKCDQNVHDNRILLSKITKWFENVCPEDGCSKNLHEARSLLEEIVSLKIVQVFLTPLHKKVSYIIDLDTDVESLKKKIAEKCQHDLQHLILYNKTTKTVLDNPNEKIYSQNEKPGELFLAFEITSTKADCQLYAIPACIEKSKQMMLSLRDEGDSYECTLFMLGKRQDMIQDDIEDLQDQISKLRKNDLSKLEDNVEQLQNQEEIHRQMEIPVDDVLNGIDSLNKKIVMISDSLKRIDKLSSKLRTSIMDFLTKNNHKNTMEKIFRYRKPSQRQFQEMISAITEDDRGDQFKVTTTLENEIATGDRTGNERRSPTMDRRFEFERLFSLTDTTAKDKLWTQICSYQQTFSEEYNNLLIKIGPLEAELLTIKKDFHSLKLQKEKIDPVNSNEKKALANPKEEIEPSNPEEGMEATNSNPTCSSTVAVTQKYPANPKEAIESSNPIEGMGPTNLKPTCSSTAAVAQKFDLTKTDSLVMESFMLQQKMENLIRLMNKKLKCSSDL